MDVQRLVRIEKRPVVFAILDFEANGAKFILIYAKFRNKISTCMKED